MAIEASAERKSDVRDSHSIDLPRSSILDAKATEPVKGGASFSLGNRLQRVVWILVWNLFASWTPPMLRRYRVALVRLFGGDVDWTANIYGSATIWHPMNLKMEAYSCLGPQVNCYCMASIHLEPYAIVSQGSHLCTGMHDIDDEHFQLQAKPIRIGKNAWVAAEAFVGPGVSVAEESVLGARSVLFKDTQPSGVYVGNPAKFIRERKRAKSNHQMGSGLG